MRQDRMNVGTVVGRLTVMLRHNLTGKARCTCECTCGNVVEVFEYNLQSKHTLSCGCLGRENSTKAKIKHGQARVGQVTAEFRAWQSMRRRCYDENSPDYFAYGYRGIGVCEAWRESFINFFLDMGPKPSALYSLDRKDTNGNYCKDNCRWATKKEQVDNRNPYYTHDESFRKWQKEKLERSLRK